MLSSFEGICLHSLVMMAEVTPVPIPNTEVKLSSADGSWDLVPVRVGRRQASLRRVRMTRLLCFITSFKAKYFEVLLIFKRFLST